MRKIFVLSYGVACYLVFLAVFLYMIGFVGDLSAPKTIDSGEGGSTLVSFVVDAILLALFAVHHSVTARTSFKRRLTRIIPAPIERSTYVLISSILLAILFGLWRAIPVVIWKTTNAIGIATLWGIFCAGWVIVLSTTFMIDHFDLFGLRQVYLYAKGRKYTPVEFKTPGLYRRIRHPIMLGFLLAFWAAPTMTLGRLLFAALMTAYVLIALRYEERDLVGFYGERYEAYKRRAGLILPKIRRS